MAFRVKHFEVQPDALPRYAYTHNLTSRILKRYTKHINDLGLLDEFQVPEFGTVQVYYIHDEASHDLSSVHVGGIDGEHVECNFLDPEDYMCNIGEINKYFGSVFLTPIELKERHNKLIGPRVIFINNANEEYRTNNRNDRMTVSSPDKLANNIGILLERDVLKILFERVYILHCLIEIKHLLDAFATLDAETSYISKQLFAEQSEKKAVKIEIVKVFQLWCEARRMVIEQLVIAQFTSAPSSFKENLIKTMLVKNNNNICSLPFPVSQMVEDLLINKNYFVEPTVDDETQLVPEFVRGNVVNLKTMHEQFQQSEQLQRAYICLVNEISMQRHVTEQLYGQIQGLFYRSMVPREELPKVMPEINKVLDEVLAREILSVKGVTSTGYRFSTLSIFLDASMSVDEKESTESDLTRLMNTRNVLKYVFCYEQKDITKFREVGSTISVRNQGTLGGFAALGANREMCVLLARHLADQSDRNDPYVYFKESSTAEDKSAFARVLQPRIQVERNATLDIALAKVILGEQSKCEVGFKDEHGKRFPATLHSFDDLAWLNGLDVHIWGAGSSPGLGVIVIPLLYVKDMENQFLKKEDREPELDQEITRFAKGGDSGAVVCANDINRRTVHVLAMLIGSSNYYQVTQDPATKQQYMAFRLLNGLQQLGQEQQNEVTLL